MKGFRHRRGKGAHPRAGDQGRAAGGDDPGCVLRLLRRDLISDLKSETSGWFETGLVALARGPLLNDVHLLREAMSGMGTKEKALNDVLLSRSNADINAIKGEYQRVFRRRLEDDVRGDLSMKTERHFMIVLSAQRAEDAAPVVQHDLDRDVNDMYNATEGKVGTDEMKVCSILSTRNDNQIRAIAFEYQKKYARNLKDVIRKVSDPLSPSCPLFLGSQKDRSDSTRREQEFSGHMEDALLFQLRNAVDKTCTRPRCSRTPWSGAGTKDYLLVSRTVRFRMCHFPLSLPSSMDQKST